MEKNFTFFINTERDFMNEKWVAQIVKPPTVFMLQIEEFDLKFNIMPHFSQFLCKRPLHTASAADH